MVREREHTASVTSVPMLTPMLMEQVPGVAALRPPLCPCVRDSREGRKKESRQQSSRETRPAQIYPPRDFRIYLYLVTLFNVR